VETVSEGERIAHLLLEKHLIACCNILPGISSVYRWQGKMEKSAEVLLLMKSTFEQYPEIEKAIRSEHSYEVPEILAVPVTKGSESYLKWINQTITG
jgi:periplasmic divalent cation tolerance protein